MISWDFFNTMECDQGEKGDGDISYLWIEVFLRACLHGGGGPQEGEVSRLGGVTRLSIWSRILIWSRLHGRWGDPPRRVARSTRPGYSLSRGQILPCKRSTWGNSPSRGLIRDTSNSPKIHFGGGFASLLEETIESHSTEGCSKSSKWVLKSINRQNTWFASICLVYLLSDHSIILRKCTPGWRVVRLHVKEGYCFTPPKRVTSRTWGPPRPCKQVLKEVLGLLPYEGATIITNLSS